MSESQPENKAVDVKTVEVEPVDEGVRIKPKRQLNEAQLANLKKGREKLAEKRKVEKEQKDKEGEKEKTDTESNSKTNTDTEPEEDELPFISCSIM